MSAPTYRVRFREFGRGPWTTRTFPALSELQTYVRGRWEGPDYIETPRSWHTDYCSYELLGGLTLQALGHRKGAPNTDAYWDWEWDVLASKTVGGEV